MPEPAAETATDAPSSSAISSGKFIVFGAAIIVGMLVSGDRVASLLGRLLRRIEASAVAQPEVGENTS